MSENFNKLYDETMKKTEEGIKTLIRLRREVNELIDKLNESK